MESLIFPLGSFDMNSLGKHRKQFNQAKINLHLLITIKLISNPSILVKGKYKNLGI